MIPPAPLLQSPDEARFPAFFQAGAGSGPRGPGSRGRIGRLFSAVVLHRRLTSTTTAQFHSRRDLGDDDHHHGGAQEAHQHVRLAEHLHPPPVAEHHVAPPGEEHPTDRDAKAIAAKFKSSVVLVTAVAETEHHRLLRTGRHGGGLQDLRVLRLHRHQQPRHRAGRRQGVQAHPGDTALGVHGHGHAHRPGSHLRPRRPAGANPRR